MTFPEFTLENYLNGKLTDDIGRYYNDQFPLRDFFLESASITNPLYLFRGLDKEDDVIMFDRVNVLDMTAPTTTQQQNTTTENTAADVTNPTVTERDTSGSTDPEIESAEPNVETVNTAMTYVNEIIAENFRWSQQNAENFANTINRSYLECGEIETYVLIPPSPSQIYLPSRYIDDENDPRIVFSQFSALLDGPVLVDLTEIYTKNKGEYLYFRTDHHWTALGAYYAYSELMRSMGESVNPISSYESGVRSGFLGGLYKASLQSPVAQLAASNPDDVVYYFPQSNASVVSYNDFGMLDGTEGQLIDPDYDRNDNLYNIFMSGDMPLAHIQSDVKNGKSVMVVRDSLGHAFLPFLADSFEHVYAVEPRYFNHFSQNFILSDFMAENGIDTLVFLGYSMPSIGVYWTTTNENTVKMLRD